MQYNAYKLFIHVILKYVQPSKNVKIKTMFGLGIEKSIRVIIISMKRENTTVRL